MSKAKYPLFSEGGHTKSLKTQEKANEYKFNDMEQYSKRSNITIEGIRDKENETASETEEKVL
ncbi:hypothetical protein DPMN_091219 [Dreissena polymorpha]|uniref:Uncharacterized protein n=1 Tax=Dreissena polymorpha TaxID=45954 RepID=A0A9D4QYY1_DREPO|nr:hypothetical protein DPMN_091219 [Dreissena polymorpha]